MTKTAEDLELFHYGVKGMKWGVTRDDAVLARIGGRKMAGETKEDKERYKEYKKSTTRKERRADKKTVAQERAKHLLEESVKNPEKMVVVRDPYGGVPTMMQGKEFVDRISQGRAFSPMDTAITDITINDLARG